MFSKKINAIAPSMTLSIAQKAAQMRSDGQDVISLSTGEPDFPTPISIKEAAKNAIDSNVTRYTPVDGLPALKDAIVYKAKRDQNMEVKHNEIVVSTGAKQSLFNMMFALIDSGDEVIIPAPYWVSYPEIVKACGGNPIIVQTQREDRFFITPESLKQSITHKTKMIIINSPSNPTGQVITEKELSALADVLIDYPNILICSDDIYEHMTWGQPFKQILDVAPFLRDRVISINGVSKAYAMTGWRIGWAIAHPDIAKNMKKIQSQSTSNPCSISQMASIAALMCSLDILKPMQEAFKKRHQFIYDSLSKHQLLNPIESHGTFYSFVDATLMIEKLNLKDDLALGDYLLENQQLAVVPGSAFGQPGSIRLSFAASEDNLKEAVKRLFEII